MEIKKEKNGSVLTVAPVGQLDTHTAPEFEAAVKGSLEGVTKIIMDFAGLEFITSAGLRVIILCKKKLPGKDAVVIRHVNNLVREVFEMTGMTPDVLTIE